MTLKDKLQIILITYNREYHLKRTLQQLFSSTSPIKECDITILDNASTDNTGKIISQYQKQYPNLKHTRHKKNIGGNANICRAFELGASNNKEYLWVLCDDDYYDWSNWNEVEQAMKNKADCIGVARYGISNDNDLNDKAHQLFQLTFVPAGIYKTKNITDTILTNMYDTIYSMFQHSVLAITLINSQKKIEFLKHPIVENGLHIEDKNQPQPNCSYYRGANASEVFFRRKEQCWIIGFANIIRLLNDKNLQEKCIKTAINYQDIHGNWNNFYNCLAANYGQKADMFHYFLEVLAVLPPKNKTALLRKSEYELPLYQIGLISPTQYWYSQKIKNLKKIAKIIFSIKNTPDKQHKVITFLGLKLKIKKPEKQLL